MFEKLTDIFSFVEKAIRILFYQGAGMYLALKASIIIPQHPGIPDWLGFPAFAIAAFGGLALALKVGAEPSPRQIREEKRKAEFNERILSDISRMTKNGGI